MSTEAITYESLRAVWPRNGGNEDLTLRQLARRRTREDDPLVIPDYQRDRMWTQVQAERFIGFLAEGGRAPALYVQRWSAASNRPDELLDGLQRLTAVERFVAGDIAMELSDGRRALLTDLDEYNQTCLIGTAGPTLRIQYVLCPTRAEVLRFYLRLNRGGTVHADADIQRVEALLKAETP